jgi:Holliday junction resolvase RusA-like endonuclease
MKLTLQIAPQAWQRVRRTRTGHCYVPNETRSFKANLARLVRALWCDPPMVGPLRLEITFFLPKLKKPKSPYPTARVDADNLAKSVMDSLNRILWLDDSQVCTLIAHKRYGDTPHIELELTPL